MKMTFDAETETRLRAISRRKVIRTALLTALWSAAVIAVWLFYLISANRSVVDFTTVFVLILLALPFLLFSVHKTLLGKTYYADVADAQYAHRYKKSSTALGGTWSEMKNAEIEIAVVTLKTDAGETERMEFAETSVFEKEMYYKPGDRVLKLQGLKFPVKCPMEPDAKILCPKCGNFTKPGIRRCGWCRVEF